MTEEQVIKGTQLVKRIEDLERALKVLDIANPKVHVHISANKNEVLNIGASVSLDSDVAKVTITSLLLDELDNAKEELSVL